MSPMMSRMARVALFLPSLALAAVAGSSSSTHDVAALRKKQEPVMQVSLAHPPGGIQPVNPPGMNPQAAPVAPVRLVSKMDQGAAEPHPVGTDDTVQVDELHQMQGELEHLRGQLSNCKKSSTGDKTIAEMDDELQGLQDMLRKLEGAEAGGSVTSHTELRTEIQHLRNAISRLEKFSSVSAKIPVKPHRPARELRYRVAVNTPEPKVQLAPLALHLAAQPTTDVSTQGGDASNGHADVSVSIDASGQRSTHEHEAMVPCPEGGIDIDTDMPYGELEPFGREDTAQELTESSITESDEMVDQLERAEVAEEKRAVFRALTRLRGAAITSFDGVARSQTGNIDEYNKVHKWRSTHPLRHLADEESDISKWAFPDNADLLQTIKTTLIKTKTTLIKMANETALIKTANKTSNKTAPLTRAH